MIAASTNTLPLGLRNNQVSVKSQVQQCGWKSLKDGRGCDAMVFLLLDKTRDLSETGFCRIKNHEKF